MIATWAADLAPVPGRARRAVVMAVCCGLVAMASKALSLPEAAISAYLIFFASKEETAETVLIALGLCLAAIVAVGFAIVLLMATGGAAPLRIGAMFAIAFAAMYAARATSAGVIAATLGMALFEVLSLMDYVPWPDLVLRGLFWLLAVVFLPMAVLAAANLLFGRGAMAQLRDTAARRDRAIRAAALSPGPAAMTDCAALLATGDGAFHRLRRLARLAGTLDKTGDARLLAAHDRDTLALAQGAAGRAPAPPLFGPLPPLAPPDTGPTDHADALRFALKATLAIAICYAIFLLADWPAIHTITITAFLVSLGSTGETLHKSALRITGCLIGAVIAGLALFLVVPHLTSAAGLGVLSALVLLPAAWVAIGPERTAYGGMQVALVFLLVVVNTSGPSVDFAVAWGRIVGIIAGNLVVALVFLTLWPNDGLAAISASLARGERALARMRNLHGAPGAGLALGDAATAGAEARAALDIAAFDPQAHRRNAAAVDALHRRARALSLAITGRYGAPDGQPKPPAGTT